MVVGSVTRDIGFARTNTNLSDGSGSVLISTNGTFVANALGDTLLSGSGLNPGDYTDLYPEFIFISQGVLLLPKPEDSNIYYLLHMTIDNSVDINAEHLLLTSVDMSLDGGLGAVVSKNVSILDDEISLGHLTAVRHANGRDWWAFCRKLNTNTFYRYLISPAGINLDGTQSIGDLSIWATGQVCFSPDGSKFAYYWRDIGLEVFQFDRCTGLFSSPVSVTYTDLEFGNGAAFSPNGRYLYITDVDNVYQYDTEAPDLAASEVLIAEWDSTYSPFPPLATLFDIAQLAPDGKIYIGTGNSTDKLHVIHAPDSAGLACNIEQHGISLPRYFSNSLPNHPNYHLGPVDGSVCDSLGINNGMSALAAEGLRIQAYPNPSMGTFTLSYPSIGQIGVMEVRDLAGKLILHERLPPWSQVHQVQLVGASPGLYNCRISWGPRSVSTRIMVVEP
ncbi:MAG: hypothetical protein GFGODING_01275 [Flavobacteriales bacterium]|nr:hypothetical protein [Flavobacteriales bacterium]